MQGTNRPSILQLSIMKIFATDTKTSKYLEKRFELDDEAFIDAAKKQRPKNRKLIDFLDERRVHLENTVPPEVEEEVAETEPEISKDDQILLQLREIFAKDSGTLKRINRNYVQGVVGEALVVIALKARPKNAKTLAILHEIRFGPKRVVEEEDVVDDTWSKEVADKVSKEDDEVKVTTAAGKYDNVVVGKIKGKVEKIGKVSHVAEGFDVRAKLLVAFSTDTGTLKAINKKIGKNIGDDDLIEMCLSRRPKNAKLKAIMKDLSDFRESEDDVREFEGDDSIVGDYEIKAQMKVDNIPYVQNDDKNLTMFINGEMEVINNEHPNFKKIVKCLEEEKWNDIIPMLDIRCSVANLVYKQLEFKNDTLYHEGKELDGALIDFILAMVESGENDIQPFMRFLHKLLKNPSKRAQKELYSFLASGKIPINERGNILTYKRINENWTDCHSGSISNKVGETVSMERGKVDDRSTVTCSQGLHVCSYSYLSSFGGGRTVICEVNPLDVVSIPSDYRNAKMRCCKYTILKEIKNNEADVLSESPIYFK
jgi:hypothetical protein